jgi:hypothetical protein
MFDATLHAQRTAAGGMLLDAGPATLRELIRVRLHAGWMVDFSWFAAICMNTAST